MRKPSKCVKINQDIKSIKTARRDCIVKCYYKINYTNIFTTIQYIIIYYLRPDIIDITTFY